MEAEQPETVSLVWTSDNASSARLLGWGYNDYTGIYARHSRRAEWEPSFRRRKDEQARLTVIEQAQAGNPIALKALKLEILRAARSRSG